MKKYILIGCLIMINVALISTLVLVMTGTAGALKHETNPSPAAVTEPPVVTENVDAPDTAAADTVTLKKFLTTAMEPVGSTMYVYGGGWNKEDTGAGEYAVTIGVPEEWREFYNEQTAAYDSSEHRYEITKGLDCSGYLGWAVYNTLETENGREGYVFFAKDFADKLSAMGFGEKTDSGYVTDYRPGDIMSSVSDSHVWISLGQCSDGSVVLVHSSPPGVRICGTAAPDGNTDSEAVAVAERYMSEQFPDWYAKFPNCMKNTSYLTNYDRFRWYLDGRGVMSDPDGFALLSPDEVLANIFNEQKD